MRLVADKLRTPPELNGRERHRVQFVCLMALADCDALTPSWVAATRPRSVLQFLHGYEMVRSRTPGNGPQGQVRLPSVSGGTLDGRAGVAPRRARGDLLQHGAGSILQEAGGSRAAANRARDRERLRANSSRVGGAGARAAPRGAGSGVPVHRRKEHQRAKRASVSAAAPSDPSSRAGHDDDPDGGMRAGARLWAQPRGRDSGEDVTELDVAIVGAGASGALTALHIRRASPRSSIALVEAGARTARGLAYGTP